ncbi:MAG TPA: ribokinase, partial [Verrucomicrobiales bacterium]|nr:ribokinase [Verrucomicrobiales bacterium]
MNDVKQIAVIGSLNIDYFARVDSLPKPGETIHADRFDLFRGGKGANQAISAIRQGCRVVLFGVLGSDDEGAAYREELKKAGVDISRIRKVSGPTGAAFITVDRNGENMIVTAAGANQALKREDIARHATIIEDSALVLGQFEVSFAPLVEAARLANSRDIPVVINPSPFNPTFPWDEIRTDYAIVNRSEAAELLGFSPGSSELSHVRQQLHHGCHGWLQAARAKRQQDWPTHEWNGNPRRLERQVGGERNDDHCRRRQRRATTRR